jgi:hypothetical protein
VAACVVAAPGVATADTRALVAVDSYIATTPDDTPAATSVADLALSARLDWRADDAPRAVVVDWVDRESLIGDDPRRELEELSYTDRSLDHLTLRAGRFRVPGGFWLIVDGAGAAYRSDGGSGSPTIEAGAYVGSRAFTSERVDTLLSTSPFFLPLVGAAITARGAATQAELAYTYTYDRIDFDLGGEAVGGPGEVIASSRQPEQYVDAELASQLSEHVFVTAGGNIGDRYLVTYPVDPGRLTDDPALDKIYFGSQAAFALADARLDNAWRFTATAALLHASLGGLGAADAADVAALAPITGSFGEGSVRARWRPLPALRLDARYRGRVRIDGTRDQRAQLTAAWRRGALEASAMLGVDIEHPGSGEPGLVRERSLIYRASVGRRSDTLEVQGGAAAVAALGDELSVTPGDDPNDQRAPYTLEARTYAFVEAFAHLRGWFGGVDGEVDLHGQGVRVLTQIGWTR